MLTWEEFRAAYIRKEHDKARLDVIKETEMTYEYLIKNFDSESNLHPEKERLVIDLALHILRRVADDERGD